MEEKLQNVTIGKGLLIGLAAAGFYWLSVYDDGVAKENQIQAISAEIATKQGEIESINKAIEDAERFQQQMNTLGAEMDGVLLAMPAKLTGLDLMSIMSSEAKNVGAEINRINSSDNTRQNYGDNDTEDFYEAVPVEVDITGTYNQVMLFLSALTRIDKIVTTRKLDLKTDAVQEKADPVAPKITMKANFLAYRYLPKDKEAKK